MRTEGQRLGDVGVVSLVILALDGVDVDPVIPHQMRRHVVLSGKWIGGAQCDLGSRRPQCDHQIGSFGRDVKAAGKLDSLQRVADSRSFTRSGRSQVKKSTFWPSYWPVLGLRPKCP